MIFIKTKTLIRIVLFLLISYLIFLTYPSILKILFLVIKVLSPFIIGFVLAFILIPVVDFLNKIGIKRGISVTITSVFAILFFVSLLVFFIPKLVYHIEDLIEEVPNYIDKINIYIEKISAKLSFLPEEIRPNKENITNYLSEKLSSFSSKFVLFFKDIFSYLFLFLLCPIIMIYFLNDYNNIIIFLKKKLSPSKIDVLIELKNTMREYFKGIILVIILLSVVCGIIYWIMGVNLPFMMGFIIGMTNLIPYFGPYLGIFFVVIFQFSVNNQVIVPLIIATTIIQIIESNYITPKIQSKNIKTSPLLVLFSLTVFGELLGIIGLIIAIPILSIIQVFIKKRVFMKKNNF